MRWKLIGEFVLLFVLLPVGFRFKPFPFPIIPALWLLTVYCLFRLLRDPSFDRTLLWNSVALRTRWLRIFLLFLVLAALIAAGIYSLHPDWLFILVRKTPWFWLLVMVLYPVLSVYPQGIVFRAFLFQRYRQIFRSPVAITIASALAFSFAHIVFRNWIAVSFTLVGGVIFAWRYRQSRSLLTSSFEHALYGCWMFTVGLGDFFYRGMH